MKKRYYCTVHYTRHFGTLGIVRRVEQTYVVPPFTLENSTDEEAMRIAINHYRKNAVNVPKYGKVIIDKTEQV